MNLVFIVMWVVSLAFSVVVGAAALTYIRRTWQLIRSDADGSAQDRILDGVDHLETQMHLVAERLGALEGRLAELDERLGGPTGAPALPQAQTREAPSETSAPTGSSKATSALPMPTSDPANIPPPSKEAGS